MQIEEYIIGTSQLPKWVQGRLLPFKKMDGSTGYEWRGYLRTYDLDVGDKLIKYGRDIYVSRKWRDD